MKNIPKDITKYNLICRTDKGVEIIVLFATVDHIPLKVKMYPPKCVCGNKVKLHNGKQLWIAFPTSQFKDRHRPTDEELQKGIQMPVCRKCRKSFVEKEIRKQMLHETINKNAEKSGD